jgi:hypothetical protein
MERKSAGREEIPGCLENVDRSAASVPSNPLIFSGRTELGSIAGIMDAMEKWIVGATIAAIAILPISGISQTKTKGKQTPKPTATAPTKGTAQLPGDNGKYGVTYQLGDPNNELHFTLDSAEIVMRSAMAQESLLADKDQRLLKISFTVQNPQKWEVPVDGSAFRFTAVSPDDQNFESRGGYYHPDRLTPFSSQLKPAQKVKAIALWPIHGTGPVTKLMVRRGNGKVLRYDLRDQNKLKLMTTIFSKDGLSAENTGIAEFGKPFDAGYFDMTIENVEKLDKFGRYSGDATNAVFVVTAQITNKMSKAHSMGWATFRAKLTDENGEVINWVSDVLTASGSSTIQMEMEPGQSTRAKWIFRGPKTLVPKNLQLDMAYGGRIIKVTLP